MGDGLGLLNKLRLDVHLLTKEKGAALPQLGRLCGQAGQEVLPVVQEPECRPCMEYAWNTMCLVGQQGLKFRVSVQEPECRPCMEYQGLVGQHVFSRFILVVQ